MEITICTLMSGRFYVLEAYFWGLSIINYPKDKLHLLFLTNSDNDDFIHLMNRRIEGLKEYASVRFIKTDIVKPSTNAFIEDGEHVDQHAETIAKLYNEVYKNINTEYFLFIEDDILAPSNVLTGLIPCYEDDSVGYACGTQMNRHTKYGGNIFTWDLDIKYVFGEHDVCKEKSYYAVNVRKPWGIREVGLSHFGLTLLRKSILEKLPKPIFKQFSSLPNTGALRGCDMVCCLELAKIDYKRLCNYDVRALHMDTKGCIH